MHNPSASLELDSKKMLAVWERSIKFVVVANIVWMLLQYGVQMADVEDLLNALVEDLLNASAMVSLLCWSQHLQM